MQTEHRMAINPQTKLNDLGCESASKWLLPSTSTIAICYYYSTQKPIHILPSHGGWKVESTIKTEKKEFHCTNSNALKLQTTKKRSKKSTSCIDTTQKQRALPGCNSQRKTHTNDAKTVCVMFPREKKPTVSKCAIPIT